MSAEFQGLVSSINAAFGALGVKARAREYNGVVEYQMMIPTQPRRTIVSARVVLPSDAIGAMIGKKGKFRKAIKKVAKKVAKSKVLRKVGKLLPALTAVIPGGQVLTGALAAVKVAKGIAKGIKSRNPKIRAKAAVAAKVVSRQLNTARTTAIKPAPGYPPPSPNASLPADPVAANYFPDAEDSVDTSPVEIDASDEQDDLGDDDSADDSADYDAADAAE
jgi:predicted RNA-binding protein YlqC (UPF0109 family)